MTTSKDKIDKEDDLSQDLTKIHDQVLALSIALERINLHEYIQYLSNPKRMILLNFGIGLLRGLGATIGATVLAGILFMILKKMVLMNLPVIGGIIGEIIKIVNAHNGY